MCELSSCILAGFMKPMEIATTPSSLLWILPLLAAIAVVYKVTKLPSITLATLIKEVSMLFASIAGFMALVAAALYIIVKITVG